MAKSTKSSENLSAGVDSHLLLETGKNLNFDVQGGTENTGGISPDTMDVAAMSPNTPPKDTSGNVYEKPQNEVLSNEAGTQLFGIPSDDSD
jgi:hypothetical protein